MDSFFAPADSAWPPDLHRAQTEVPRMQAQRTVPECRRASRIALCPLCLCGELFHHRGTEITEHLRAGRACGEPSTVPIPPAAPRFLPRRSAARVFESTHP